MTPVEQALEDAGHKVVQSSNQKTELDQYKQAIKNLEADNEFIEQIIMFLRHYQKRNTEIANLYTEKQQTDGKEEI